MKKEDMIKTIQQEESRLFLKMYEYEQIFGEESNLYKRVRGEWCTVYELMEKLNIKPDTITPEFEKVMKIINEKRMIKQFEQDDFDSKDISAY